MRQMVWPALAAMLAFGMLGCATQPSQNVPTRADDAGDITALLTGKTFYGSYPDGTRWTEYVAKGGDTAYREGDFTCPGRWRVSGDVACFAYEGVEPSCFNLWQLGNQVLFVPVDGDPRGDDVTVADRIVEGDPEGLMEDRITCPE